MSVRALACCLFVLLCACDGKRPAVPAPEQAVPVAPASAVVEEAVNEHPEQLLFGDLHVHTSYSPDAFVAGNRNTTPDDAYRFAKGEQTLHAGGFPVQMHRALDFAAVTDHSEYLGVLPQTANPDSPLSRLPIARRLVADDPQEAQRALFEIIASLAANAPIPELNSAEVSASLWREVIASANRHNAPGTFTALVGYEWTSMVDGANLHRNVIFRSDAVPERPFSSFDSPDPEQLWGYLEASRAAGMDNLAIPHNANASDGLMFGTRTFDGRPFDADYVARRIRNEPVQEIVQIKGQSEVHPQLAPNDEFANFEIFPFTLKPSIPPPVSRPAGGYAREALGVGLELAARGLGNPYRFGFIGSSDAHNSTTAIEEDNYHGKLVLVDGTPERRLALARNPVPPATGRVFSAAGLAAVWASANTREAIFDAVRRGETYATSGTRIRLRVFAGWDYGQPLLGDPAYLDAAYAQGVPMGADLPARPATATAPRLLIRAAKDPDGANLDRVQVIKGWLAADGTRREKIFDVAWGGAREPDPATGKLPAIGSTVDVAQASYTNTIGAPSLDTLWQDPEFDPAAHAFYYVRVLEIPTPSWSTYDAFRLHQEAPGDAELQERAWSSPIWYVPATVPASS